ncbi:MAG: hypothetical protein WBC35_07590 [Saprospiraceae bacterium]
MNKNFIVILLLSVLGFSLGAQNILLGGGPTMSTYFGDLAPYNLKRSFGQVNPGLGLYFTKRVLDPIYVKLDFEHSQVSADDKDQTSDTRKERNLSFRSPVTSLSGLVGLRIGLLKNRRAGITGGVGIAGFYFDPHAQIDGNWVRLQPLRTEGQGLSGSTAKEYSLSQIALSVQGGIFIRITEKFYFDIELTQYFTSTDYLDDVSGVYYDNELLRQYRGDLAARLADRHTELLPPGSPNFSAGTPRGNPTKNDQFAYLKFGISIALDRKQGQVRNSNVKCPQISKDWFEK